MSQKSESAYKGLSFIDWDDLSEEEYEKLDRIINTPSSCSGLPYSAQCEKPFAPEQFEESAVFHSVIPTPPVVGYSIPVHWAHGDPAICPPGGTPYPVTVPGGYVFPNPAMTATGETTMAFVSPISSVQPVYAITGISGHHMAPHFQSAAMPQEEPVDLTLPLIRPAASCLDGGIVLPEPQPVPLPLKHVSQPVTNMAPVISQMVPMCHQDVQHAHAPQVVFISQASIVPPTLADSAPLCQVFENSSQSNIQVTPQSVAITGLPPTHKTPIIEFGGPVVFTNSLSDSNGHLTSKSKTLPQSERAKEVVIDMEALNISDSSDSPKSESQPVRHLAHPHDSDTTSSLSLSAPDAVVATVSASCKVQDKINSLSHKEANSESPLKHTAAPQVKTWSSLFGSKGAGSAAAAAAPHVLKPTEAATAAVPNAVLKDEVKSVTYWQEQEKAAEVKQTFVPSNKVVPVGVQNDPLALTISNKLYSLPIIHTPIVIQPRGLVNGSNICFMNATLQVLMGCPPFVHMFRAFGNLPARPGSCSSTPIFDSLVQFVNSFQNGERIRNQGSRKKNAFLDINIGQPFSPAPLLNVAQSILGLHIGVQHDAEEFLSQILMICHEELESVMKLRLVDGLNNNQKEHNKNGFPETIMSEADEGNDDDESWQKVGPKNHHVETNVNVCGQTPLSSIFAGLSRSCLVRESGKSSDTVDSFFTLKLDIQADGVHSVNDALLRLNTVETVHDADGGKVQGKRRMFFDVLPPVLIMHLKLFQYSNGNGQKIQKKIDFDVDLVIPKETLSKAGKTKLASVKSRSYKLFGVVNHHGMKMNDGHYTSDVYLPVASGWLHFDDSEVAHIHESQVLQYSDRQMPYLLFYRRMDV